MANIIGTQGNDNLIGTSLADLVSGLGGIDTLSGGEGNDRIYGGNGDDKLYGAAGGNQDYDGPDEDWIDGGNGNDVMAGGYGDDVLFGRSADDRIYGGGGDDVMFGGVGNDMLSSGGGRDVMTGNTGNDIYRLDFDTGDLPSSVLYVDHAEVVITDFVSGQDRLLITSRDTQGSAEGGTTSVSDMLTFKELDTNGDRIVDGSDLYTDQFEGSLVINLDAASATSATNTYSGFIELQGIASLKPSDIVG